VTELACYGSAVLHDPADVADHIVGAVLSAGGSVP